MLLIPISYAESACVDSQQQSSNIVVLVTDGEFFEESYNAFKAEFIGHKRVSNNTLIKNTTIKKMLVTQQHQEYKALESIFTGTTPPKLVVIIGNEAANFYTNSKRYYTNRNPNIHKSPVYIFGSLYADELVSLIGNAAGMRYEIPAVTSITLLRALMHNNVNSVGIIYRVWAQEFVRRNEGYLQQEGVKLNTIQVANGTPNDIDRSIRLALKALFQQQVDAIFIVNDNILLNPQTLANAWLPILSNQYIPVIVNVPNLVAADLDFGLLSVYPTAKKLGYQAAEIVFEIINNNWDVSVVDVQEPISSTVKFNKKLAVKNQIEFNKDIMVELDLVVD